MRAALRTLRLIHLAMLVSIVLYAVVGEIAGSRFPPSITLLNVMSVASLSVVGAILVVRRTLILRAEAELREKPGDSAVLSRWQMGYIVLYALCEALALFGLVLRLMSYPLITIWPYYVGGFVLLLLFRPVVPGPEPNRSAS